MSEVVVPITMREYSTDRIDLRSDTVTQPTAAMREAIFSAPVGDDVLGDDPTVKALEALTAELLGKEAALFVSSGTMANAVAVRSHTNPGDEIVLETHSHIYTYEGGGYAALSGCSVARVSGPSGIIPAVDVGEAIRKSKGSQGHYPNATLVCIENTSNRGGGSCYPVNIIDEICEVSKARGCAVHMDGARLFNASVASGISAARLVENCDSVAICLSKGLGAPVGSLLAGSSEFIAQAHRWRKMFGGGMRQAGIIAAAGIYALENNVERLANDHARARRFGEAVNEMDGYRVDLSAVQTNMVYVTLTAGQDATQAVQGLAEQGVDLFDISPTSLRAVFHLHVTDEDVDAAINAFAQIS
jgi:threonine aldolase